MRYKGGEGSTFLKNSALTEDVKSSDFTVAVLQSLNITSCNLVKTLWAKFTTGIQMDAISVTPMELCLQQTPAANLAHCN